jgi:hypothetical protein
VLGKFLELSLHAPDVLESYQFYARLGFTSAATGDVWPYRYAVMTDGRIAIGLHQQAAAPRALCYVHPGLRSHLERIEALGIDVDYAILGDDSFNELGFRDPDGYRLRLLEARTYSTPAAVPSSLCGWFEELALPVRDPDVAQQFWERVGFVGVGEETAPFPHRALTSDWIDLGLYPGATLAAPTLRFSVEDLEDTRGRLAVAGATALAPRGLSAASALELTAPEGTQILLTADARWVTP